MTTTIEYCKLCDLPTGKSGAGEDSIFITLHHDKQSAQGPLCEDCYETLRYGEGYYDHHTTALAEKDARNDATKLVAGRLIKVMSEENDRLHGIIAEGENRIALLHKRLNERDARIAELEKQNTTLDIRLQNLLKRGT